MGYRLYVEPEAEESLDQLAERYGDAVRPASRVANVLPAVRNFLLEVDDGDREGHSRSELTGGRAWLYRVPQAWFGKGHPHLDVRVVVAGTTATVLSVTERPSRRSRSEIGPRIAERAEAVAQRLIEHEDDDAQQDP